MIGWIACADQMPPKGSGALLITDGKLKLVGVFHQSLGTPGVGGFGTFKTGARFTAIESVDGITHWMPYPQLPGEVSPVAWPASRGTEHGQLMRLHVEAENDPNAVH